MKINHIPPTVSIQDSLSAQGLLAELMNRPVGWESRLALDTETTGLSIMNDFPLFWSLSDGVDRWCLDASLLLEGIFDPLFRDPERMWVFANAKYDLHMLANYHVPLLKGRKYDIIGMSTLIDENGPQGLKTQAKKFLNINMTEFKEVLKVRKHSDIPFLLMNPDNYTLVSDYASLDAYATWLLSELHYKELMGIDYGGGLNAWDYFNMIEVPYTDCLWRVERRGILVDQDVTALLRPEFSNSRDDLQKEIFSLVGKPFNINSAPQLSDIFFDQMNLKPISYTNGGGRSLAADVLKKYAKSGVKLAQLVLDFRMYDKLISNYIEGHCGKHLASDGRVHANFNQFGTATGRLSSSGPNMQTIPSKKAQGSRLRNAFIAPEGFRLGVWDYSTLEMRVMAHMSNDVVMCDAIKKGLDLHCLTASQMLGVQYERAVAAKVVDDLGFKDEAGVVKKLAKKVSISEETASDIVASLTKKDVTNLIGARSAAKTIGFGVLYGAGPRSISEQLDVSVDMAKKRIEEWFDTFPGVKHYIDRAHHDVLQSPHVVRTISGRYRHLPEAASPRRFLRGSAQRKAVNTPIQGSAGDLVKFAMLAIDQDPVLGGSKLNGGALGVRMVLQVHDELIFEVPEETAEEAANLIVERMQNPGINMKVPLAVEGGYGKNWKEAK